MRKALSGKGFFPPGKTIGKLFDLPVVITTSAQTGMLMPLTSSYGCLVEMNATRSKWASSQGDPRNVS